MSVIPLSPARSLSVSATAATSNMHLPQHRQSCPEVPTGSSGVSTLAEGVALATHQARQHVKAVRSCGRVAAITSQFQTAILESEEMKGRNPKKFSSIAERIEVFKKASSGGGSVTHPSQRPITVRTATSSSSPSSAPHSQSPSGRGSPALVSKGTSSSSSSSRIPMSSSRTLSLSSPSSSPSYTSASRAESSHLQTDSPSTSSRQPAHRSVSTADDGRVSSTSSPRPPARHVSEPVTIRSPAKLVHTVSPIFRSSPAATPPLPKSSPPTLPQSSPPIAIPTANQSTPPLPKAPIPSYSPSMRSSPLSRRKPSNLAVSRQTSQPVMTNRSMMHSPKHVAHKSKSTSDSDDSIFSAGGVKLRGPRSTSASTSTAVSSDVLTELIPFSSASAGKSPTRRDSGCESSESIGGSPELSPPLSAVPSDSVFSPVKDRQVDMISTSSSGSSLASDVSATIEVQQMCAERDHLQLVLKNAEMTLYAVETERDALIQKNNELQQELISERGAYGERSKMWSSTRSQALRCVEDGKNFFLHQDGPVWHTTMVEILDEAVALLDGTLPTRATPSSTCSNSVRESLQLQLESVSRQLEEARRDRRTLTEKSIAWERERRQLQNEVALAASKQSSAQSGSSERVARKEQQLRDMQAKCQLLEHEKERESKQAKTLGNRNKSLELALDDARRELSQASQKQTESSRHHDGELSILRHSIREAKRDKTTVEESLKKEAQLLRSSHQLSIRERDSQIQQLEDETDQLTQKVQELEEKLSQQPQGQDLPDGRKQSDLTSSSRADTETELTRKLNRLTEDMKTERASKLQLQLRVDKLEAEKNMRSSPTVVLASSSASSLRQPSPATANKSASPAVSVRGGFVCKAASPGVGGSVHRVIATPSSLPTTSSTPPVQARYHSGAKPSSSVNRHTIAECGSGSQRSKSDGETALSGGAKQTARYGRFFSASSSPPSSAGGSGSNSTATTPGSPSMNSNLGSSPHVNHWKKLQNTVHATARLQTNSKRAMLREWCKQKLNSYRGVNIQNFHRSWRNGMAFCALIDYFSPGMIDCDSLDENNMEHNLTLAFDAGEKLGIAKLLDVADMVSMEQPEWHSVMTYVSSIYNHFNPKK